MFSKVFSDTVRREEGLLKKIESTISLIKYYNNLRKGIKSGKIYLTNPNQNSELGELFTKFSTDDFKLMDTLFREDIKKFLNQIELKTYLNFDERIGSEQIGYNTIYVENPINGLWTTGKATFFLPTKKQLKNKFIIEFRSIPPINVTVRFEKTPIKNFSIPKLSSNKIEFTMDPSKIVEDISEITISTDKLWLPNVILEVEESLTIGIGVKSIGVSYF